MKMEKEAKNKKDERLSEDFNWEGHFNGLIKTYNMDVLKIDQDEKFGDSFLQVNDKRLPLNFKNYIKYHTKMTL